MENQLYTETPMLEAFGEGYACGFLEFKKGLSDAEYERNYSNAKKSFRKKIAK